MNTSSRPPYTTRLWVHFFLVAANAPVTLAAAELITGSVKPEAYFGPWWVGALAFLAVYVLLGGLAMRGLVARLETQRKPGALGALQALILALGPVGNVIFGWIHHAASPYGNDLAKILSADLYLFAAGMFFSILMLFSILSDLESRLGFADDEGRSRLAGSLNAKLFLGISLTILAFLTGAVGATAMPYLAGVGPLESLLRVLVLAFPFLLLSGMLLRYFSQFLTQPLVVATPALEALAHDDLRARLAEPSRDELGFVFHNLNLFLDRLRTTVAEARNQARTAGDRSLALDRLVEDQNRLLGQVTDQVAALERRLEKLDAEASEAVAGAQTMGQTVADLQRRLDVQTGAVQETSAAAEELLAGARTIAETAQSRRHAAGELGQRNEENRRVLQQSLGAMTTVTGQIEKLSELNKVIAKVASQTNLLAMNAAIEAAHAGDAGRGFSVVAQEIRSLAESSAQNAKNSSEFLKGMVQSIRLSGEALQAVDRSFLEGERVTTGVVEGLEEIGTSSAEIEEASRLIVERMVGLTESNRAVNEGAGSLGTGLEAVDRTARLSREGVEASRGETKSLRTLTAELSRLATETGQGSQSLKADARALAARFEPFTVPD